MKSDVITLIGIGLTFLVGLANLFLLLRNAKRTTFTSSVTSSRIKYIQDIRESISKFCGLAHFYNSRKPNLSEVELSAVQKEADTLRYLIRLFLNPEDKHWDTRIMMLCEEVIKNTDGQADPLHTSIEDLVSTTQYLLKFEWQGVKEEAKNGALTTEKRAKLYNEYVLLHQKYILENAKKSVSANQLLTQQAASTLATSSAPPGSEAPTTAKIFLSFNYPELKDLGKHFLTISSATAVFLLTFADKVIGQNTLFFGTIKLCMAYLLFSIATAGTGLFFNYIAGSGASGAVIWGIGKKKFRAFTVITYLLYISAGYALFSAYGLLTYAALNR